MCPRERKRLNNQTMEAILRISYYRSISNVSLERAMELFLSENRDGELRKGKRRLSGYVTSSKSTQRAQGLILESSSDEDSDHEANHPSLVRPGGDLVADSSSSSSAEDDDEVDYCTRRQNNCRGKMVNLTFASAMTLPMHFCLNFNGWHI